jgi:hypothetical protein
MSGIILPAVFWVPCPQNIDLPGVVNFPNDSNVLMGFVGVVPLYQITDLHLEPQTHLEKDNVCIHTDREK